MAKRMIVMLIAVFIVFGGVAAYKAHSIMQMIAASKAFQNPPQTVSVVKAGYDNWQPEIQSVGSLRAVNGAALSLEASGIVDEIDFRSGDDVEAGTVLMKLRSDDDAAKLQSLQAAADLAQIIYSRDQKQFTARAVSQATLDTDSSNLKNAKAQVAEQQAILDKKTLRAPFAGRIGIRAVDLGQYLTAGTTIVSLQALDPIYVDFHLPQQSLHDIKVGQGAKVMIDTYPGETFTGEITAIDPLVDTNSRNLAVRATLKNPDHKLLPGMFANVRIETGEPQRYITLPQTAITYNSYGDTVFLAQPDPDAPNSDKQLAKQTFVTTGDTRGDQIAVLTGVKEGDMVVTAGQIKLHNGTPLIINNSVQPSDAADPKPKDE